SPPAPYARDYEVVDQDNNLVSNPSRYFDTSVSVVTGTLTVQVSWQWVSQQQQPITLTLKSSTTEVNYPVQTTDANSQFAVSLGSLPSDNYNWRVRGPRFLANSGTVNINTAPNYSVY